MEASTPEGKPERRQFGTLASELRRLSSWLREQGVEEAVMESTAQYRRSVWLELEPYLRLQLAQAFSNRAPRGRKRDFKDAERLMRRLIANELILSFVKGSVCLHPEDLPNSGRLVGYRCTQRAVPRVLDFSPDALVDKRGPSVALSRAGFIEYHGLGTTLRI